MKRESITCIIILIFAGLNLLAQNPYVQHYTTKDGLPSGSVYQVYSDSKNFIWFATDAGVARFDGSEFTCFSKRDGLNSNEILKIKEDAQGRLWFFNLNGSMNYFYENQIFNPTNAPFLSELESKQFFMDFFQDIDSTIYFYTYHNREIFSLDNTDDVTSYILPKTKIQLESRTGEGMQVKKMCNNPQGGLLLYVSAGLYSVQKFGDEPQLVSDEYLFGHGFQITDSKYLLRATSMIDTTERIIILSDETIENPISNSIISDEKYTSVIEAEDKVMWCSHYDLGVYCIRDNKVINHLDIAKAQAVIQDHEGNIWISSLNNCVYRINPFYNTHTHIENSSFGNAGLTAMCESPEGIWMTNGELIYFYSDNKILPVDFCTSKNKFNKLWCLDGNTLIVGEQSRNYYALNNLVPDIGSMQVSYNLAIQENYRSGFKDLAVEPETGEFYSFIQSFLITARNKENLKDFERDDIGERIHFLFINSDNELVVNAKKNYVYRQSELVPYQVLEEFNNKIITGYLQINDSIEVINVEGDSIYLTFNEQNYNLTMGMNNPIDLMVTNMVYHAPSLYLSTVHNIYVCDHPENILEDKSVELTLVDINFRKINDILICDDSLFVASNDGLTIIPVETVKNIKAKIPKPYFHSVQLNGTEVNLIQERGLILSGENKIKFSFGCINYSPSPIVYSYQLEGLDPEWTIGTTSEVVYQNLSKGDYVFRVKAKKPGTKFSSPIIFNVKVSATIWEQPFLYLALLSLLAGIIIWVVHLRARRQKMQLEMDNQLITLEQKALHSMMNPHFIFNAFSSIQNHLLKSKPAEASVYVSKFARLIRQNLSSVNSNVVKLEEEVSRIRNYLELEQLRMEHKFEFNIRLDDEIDEKDLLIPSMIIQPFVENAIWHGIATIGEKGLVKLKFSNLSQDTIKITIEDNGVGMYNSQSRYSGNIRHLNLGAQMTRKRLDILGRKLSIKTSINYSEIYPGAEYPGTRVVLVVPVNMPDEIS